MCFSFSGSKLGNQYQAEFSNEDTFIKLLKLLKTSLFNDYMK
jgi:hypothetical protein